MRRIENKASSCRWSVSKCLPLTVRKAGEQRFPHEAKWFSRESLTRHIAHVTQRSRVRARIRLVSRHADGMCECLSLWERGSVWECACVFALHINRWRGGVPLDRCADAPRSMLWKIWGEKKILDNLLHTLGAHRTVMTVLRYDFILCAKLVSSGNNFIISCSQHNLNVFIYLSPQLSVRYQLILIEGPWAGCYTLVASQYWCNVSISNKCTIILQYEELCEVLHKHLQVVCNCKNDGILN